MMQILPGVFALLVGAAGWFYMFYSHAADRLVGIEGTATNLRRVRLRRTGGGAMMLLGVAMYLAVYAARSPAALAMAWFAVIVLLVVILVLGLIDLRMTRKLRDELRKHGPR
ncbi:MAG: hypothetical protein ACREJC_14030 [Tepidisphaeraceae bacterium]